MKANKDLTAKEFAAADAIKRALHAMNCEKPLLAKKFLYDALRAIHN